MDDASVVLLMGQRTVQPEVVLQLILSVGLKMILYSVFKFTSCKLTIFESILFQTFFKHRFKLVNFLVIFI